MLLTSVVMQQKALPELFLDYNKVIPMLYLDLTISMGNLFKIALFAFLITPSIKVMTRF